MIEKERKEAKNNKGLGKKKNIDTKTSREKGQSKYLSFIFGNLEDTKKPWRFGEEKLQLFCQ